MGIMVMNTIIWVVAAISAYFAVGYFRANLKVLTEKKLGKEMTLQEVVSTKKAVLLGIICFILEAGVASAGNPTTAIVLAVVLFVAVKFVTDAAPGTAKTNETIFRWLGFPLSVGIVADVIKKVTQFGFGWNWLPFLWLIAPVLYYVILAIATAAAKNNEVEEGEEKGDWRILPRIIALLTAIVLIGGSIGVHTLVKGATEAEAAQIAAEEAAQQQAAAAEAARQAMAAEEANQSETTPAKEGPTTLQYDLSPAEQFKLAVANSTKSKEEEAILQAGMAIPQMEAEDADSKISDYQLSKNPADELARRNSVIKDFYDPGTQYVSPVSDSYFADLNTGESKDPETGHDLTYLRTYAGIVIDFCKEINSWATARAFGMYHPDAKGREFKDELEKREYIDTQMIYLIRNYAAFVELLEEWSQGTTLGEKNYDAFDFFPEGINIANHNQETGDGVYGVLENTGTAMNPKYVYTAEWENVMADFYAWYKQFSYDGTYEWWTRERGYLGPADGTAHDGVEHEFNYATVAGTRANFTTKADRQTNYPAEIFCLRDKNNGYRISDYMGINCIFSDAELFTEAPKAKKADLDKIGSGGEITVVDYKLPTNQQPSGSTKVTYTASTGEVKKVPTPTPTPKKKTKKDPSQDPANKTPGNVANESGINDDPGPGTYVAGLPPVSATTVAEAQGGNVSDYTQGIEEDAWSPSGETNDYVAPAGTTITNTTVTGENGTEVTGDVVGRTDEKTGAAVEDANYVETTDDGGSQDVHVDHEEAKTEEAHDVDTSDHEKAGSESSGNTSSWDGDESF